MSTIGALYFLTVLDDYSRAVWIYLIDEKSEMSSVLKGYFAMLRDNFIKLLIVIMESNFFV